MPTLIESDEILCVSCGRVLPRETSEPFCPECLGMGKNRCPECNYRWTWQMAGWWVHKCDPCLGLRTRLDIMARRRRIERLLKQVNVPEGYWSYTAARCPRGFPAEATQWLKKYTSGQHARWLYLFGPTGTGKTGILVSMLRLLLELRRETAKKAYFVAAREIEKAWDSRFDHDEREGAKDLLRRLETVELLFLDDLGASRGRASAGFGAVADVLYERDARGRVTVISSNLSLDELEGVDHRIASRVLSGDLLKADGVDLREPVDRG